MLHHHIRASGMTALNDLPWPNTDHRGLFIDHDIQGLFGASLNSIPATIPRKVTSKSFKITNKFVSTIRNTDHIPGLLQQIKKIEQTTTWINSEHHQLESIDTMFTNILLQAEQKCLIPTNNHWTSELHEKYLIYMYWAITIKGQKNKKHINNQLNSIILQSPEIDIFQGNST
jgi:hypothetical protein